MRRVSAGLLVLLVVMLAVLAGPDALGCPNCKDGVNTTDPDGLNVARGYFYSILFMLAMPFTLAGSFGIYVWREMRRQKLAAQGVPDAASPPAESPVEPPADDIDLVGAAVGRTHP